MSPFSHRREFLQRASLIAMAPTVPAFLRATAQSAEPDRDGRVLVVIQLSGGNDGINTVVPVADEGYAKHRKELRLDGDQLLKVTPQVAFHRALRPAADLLEDGRLAVVQGVGYPNPNRSHDVSMAIWQTARFDPTEHQTYGWVGRAMDARPRPADGSPHTMLLGDENPPVALRGRRSTSVTLAHLDDLKLASAARLGVPASTDHRDDLLAFTRRVAVDARSTARLLDSVTKANAPVSYPATHLAGRLETIARLIKAGFATPVFYAIQPGYDTHAAQLPMHGRLLRELGGALRAFHEDLRESGLSDRVLTLCFSEFGRRVRENASLGTDHGTAGPVLLAGDGVVAGVHGATPSLEDLEDGDLKMGTDFRQVYASVLEDWLHVDARSPLGGTFEKLALLR